MNRAALDKVVPLLLLLIAVAMVVAPSTDAGSQFGGFGGFGGAVIGGFGGIGGITIFGGFGGDGGSDTAQVPNSSSLLLTVLGMGVAAWGVWRNRR